MTSFIGGIRTKEKANVKELVNSNTFVTLSIFHVLVNDNAVSKLNGRSEERRVVKKETLVIENFHRSELIDYLIEPIINVGQR